MEPLQCFVIAFFVFWTGVIVGKIEAIYAFNRLREQNRQRKFVKELEEEEEKTKKSFKK